MWENRKTNFLAVFMKNRIVLISPEIQSLRDAIRDNDAEQVQRAIAAGVVPAEASFKKKGTNALMMALGLGSLDCAKVLAPFFDWEATDENGFTALMWAAQSDQAACVRFALDNNANPNRHARTGETALMLAIKMGCAGCVETLAPVSSMRARTPQGHTVLRQAVNTGNLKMVKAILSAPRPPLGVKSLDGATTLMHLIADGNSYRELFELMWPFHKQELLPVKQTGPLSWALRHDNQNAARLVIEQCSKRLEPEDLAESFVRSARSERADWAATLAAFSPMGLRAETESLAAALREKEEENVASKGGGESPATKKSKKTAPNPQKAPLPLSELALDDLRNRWVGLARAEREQRAMNQALAAQGAPARPAHHPSEFVENFSPEQPKAKRI